MVLRRMAPPIWSSSSAGWGTPLAKRAGTPGDGGMGSGMGTSDALALESERAEQKRMDREKQKVEKRAGKK